ncbi:hypothetical protein V7266_08895 [Neobacillus drentensis]|uniref:hypothetical protein n=1 Tax=Neobacillus drentensis TaxID=220684 RepID=UPI003000240F
MKKLLTVIGGLVIAGSLFVTSGNTAKAAETDDCPCHQVTIIRGAERNKMVADVISSENFKNVKKELEQDGFKWTNAHDIEVIKYNLNGKILIGIPFMNNQGFIVMAGYLDGVYSGTYPLE